VSEGLYRQCKFAKVLDESAIKVSKLNKFLNLFHSSWGWPVQNIFDFLMAHSYTLGTYLKPNKFDVWDMENALVNIDPKAIF